MCYLMIGSRPMPYTLSMLERRAARYKDRGIKDDAPMIAFDDVAKFRRTGRLPEHHEARQVQARPARPIRENGSRTTQKKSGRPKPEAVPDTQLALF